MGNLLVSLMRNLMSIAIQGLHKMSGVSNDPQQRERVHVRKRSRKTWYNCSNPFPFRGDLKEELMPAHPISEVGELLFSPNMLVLKYRLKAVQLRQTLRAGPQRMCSKQLHSPSHGANALWIKTQEEEVPSFLTAEAIRCTEVSCSPAPHSLRQSPAQPWADFVATSHCSIVYHFINWHFILKASLDQLTYSSQNLCTVKKHSLFHVLFRKTFPWTWPRWVSGNHWVRRELSSTHAGAHCSNKWQIYTNIIHQHIYAFPSKHVFLGHASNFITGEQTNRKMKLS